MEFEMIECCSAYFSEPLFHLLKCEMTSHFENFFSSRKLSFNYGCSRPRALNGLAAGSYSSGRS